MGRSAKGPSTGPDRALQGGGAQPAHARHPGVVHLVELSQRGLKLS